MNWDKLDITISGLTAHYQANHFTPRELVQHLLNQQTQDSHRIWITRLDLTQIEPYLDNLENTNPDDLPLYGIPFAIKDNIDLAGIDTTAACEAFHKPAAESATVVARLIEAGAIPMGKTNLDQFATGLVGVRSPFGACHNAFNPEFISGGSSSGSAVATALNLVSFALGTDTAGSGRVPAAFNNLIGVKPTRGMISASGVVPACQSLDCVTVFALSPDDANQVLTAAEGFDIKDPYSRSNPFDNGNRRYGLASSNKTLAIPRPENREFFGDSSAETLFSQAIDKLSDLGFNIVELDISPLMDAAKLLYEGPWVTERYLAIASLYDEQPESLLPVIREIIGKGTQYTAGDAFSAEYRLQKYRQTAAALFGQIDALVTPTAPTCYRIEELENDPIQLNSRLGTYTNFMNLLDLSAVAVPAGFLDSGVGFGITLQAPAFHDRALLSIANTYCSAQELTCGAGQLKMPTTSVINPSPVATVDLVVCGAHLDNMPLNWQLTERGANKISLTRTSANYRLYAMEDGRPALFRDDHGGHIEVEVWRLAKSDFGSFVADIPAPLGIGKVELEDGRWLPSFIAEPRAKASATDITKLCGWRNYIDSKEG